MTTLVLLTLLAGRPAARAVALERARPARPPGDPRGVGDRQEPASTRGSSGSTTTRATPPPCSPSAATARSSASIRSTSRTSTGKTSPPTTAATSTSATSATTTAACRSGPSTRSTSPTRPRRANGALKVDDRQLLPVPARRPVRRRGAGHRRRPGPDRRQDVRRPRRPRSTRSRSTRPPPCSGPAVAERVGTLAGFTEPVTGADLSPDGRRLVVCSLGAVRRLSSRTAAAAGSRSRCGRSDRATRSRRSPGTATT